jgi:hypothetical protein
VFALLPDVFIIADVASTDTCCDTVETVAANGTAVSAILTVVVVPPALVLAVAVVDASANAVLTATAFLMGSLCVNSLRCCNVCAVSWSVIRVLLMVAALAVINSGTCSVGALVLVTWLLL